MTWVMAMVRVAASSKIVRALVLTASLLPAGGCVRRADPKALRAKQIITPNGAITSTADDLRTGWYPNQPLLDPATVGGKTFGRLWRTVLPLSASEQVFAQPLVSNGAVFVVTESNNLYSLDSETGAVKASRALGAPWRANELDCSDLVPVVGITGSPVIDTATNTAYLFSKTYGPSGAPVWYAHAVDVNTLAERSGFPTEIQGTAANDASVTFTPKTEMQRPGLLLMNGVVYAAFGGICDLRPYRGWVVGVGVGGAITTMFSTQAGSGKGMGAGIWQSGGGLLSDGDGRIFFVTGNELDTDTDQSVPQPEPPGALGESVVRLDLQPDGSLRAADYFAPYDRRTLDLTDNDFGSSGPAGLPSQHFGTPSHPNLLVTGSKAGRVYLLDRDSLGGFKMGSGGGDRALGILDGLGPLWSRPGVWPGDGGWIYVVPSFDRMKALRYGADGNGVPSLQVAGNSVDQFGYTSGSPIVTSNGTAPGSALVWATFTTGAYGSGQLRAYDAVPDGDQRLTLRFQDSYGTHAKFSVPGVGEGRVYLGTADGAVLGYGAPLLSPVSAPNLDFGDVVVGASRTSSLTITATTAITVTGLSSAATGFTLGTPSPSLPATLTGGGKLNVPVTFAPAAAKLYAGSVSITTSAGAASTSVQGTGLAGSPVLAVNPPVLGFGGHARGTTSTMGFTLSNGGAMPLVWSGFTLPTAPFSVSGLPAVGASLAPGAAISASAAFAPDASGDFTGSLVIASTGGTVSLFFSGSAGDPPLLVVTPLALNFGTVAPGSSASLTFTVENRGGTDLTLTRSKAPGVGTFVTTTPLPEGTIIPAGGSRTLTVTFAPTAPGAFADQWTFNGNDTSGVQTVSLTGNSSGASAGLTATYFDRIDLTGNMVSRVDPTVDFNWAYGSPALQIPVDNFSVRWTGQVLTPTSEPFTFYTRSDDGVRLWIDGQLVIDDWTDHGDTEDRGTVPLAAGSHDLRMEFYERAGRALASLAWSSPSMARQIVPQGQLSPAAGTPGRDGGTDAAIRDAGAPAPDAGAPLRDAGVPARDAAVLDSGPPPAGGSTGLTGTYYDRMDLAGNTVVRVDPTVSFDWGLDAPAPTIPADNFSVRWSGQVLAPASELFTFFTTSDDGVRLWVDGHLLVDDWTDHGPTEDRGTIALVAGRRYDITMEFYERGEEAVVSLSWSSPSIARQVIPGRQLVPARGPMSIPLQTPRPSR